MIEDEVAQDVGALYRPAVGCVVLVELGVLGLDPLGGDVVRPKPVLLTFLALVESRACAVCFVILFGRAVTMLLKPDVVQNLRHHRIAGIVRHGINVVLECDVEVTFDFVKVDVGVDSFSKVPEERVEFVLREFPGEDKECKYHHCEDPSYDLHTGNRREVTSEDEWTSPKVVLEKAVAWWTAGTGRPVVW